MLGELYKKLGGKRALIMLRDVRRTRRYKKAICPDCAGTGVSYRCELLYDQAVRNEFEEDPTSQ